MTQHKYSKQKPDGPRGAVVLKTWCSCTRILRRPFPVGQSIKTKSSSGEQENLNFMFDASFILESAEAIAEAAC